MENDIVKLIESIRNEDNPIIKAEKLSFYVSDSLKSQRLTIYESYLLHEEILNYMREGYTIPAWNGLVQISTCLEIFNQRLVALVFGDLDNANLLKKWGGEALRLCTEKRSHYIIDRYEAFMNIDNNSDILLEELLAIRKNYASLNDKKGPYHVEVFPYHYFEPEKILLEKEDTIRKKCISTDIETILIGLNI